MDPKMAGNSPSPRGGGEPDVIATLVELHSFVGTLRSEAEAALARLAPDGEGSPAYSTVTHALQTLYGDFGTHCADTLLEGISDQTRWDKPRMWALLQLVRAYRNHPAFPPSALPYVDGPNYS
ncbi:hypothetical protein [Streptomyces sp. cg36]|uniref:hypothetical protein n=1 Tax=Streptomyces sp. cg36 TaxID=3238798 RepID=UPI0034E1DD5F